MDSIRQWFKEPLLHFIVAGGLLFAAYGWFNRGSDNQPQVVHITKEEVNWLRGTWTRQWQRPPDEQELQNLVADYLKQELLAREARDFGLEENDIIIRRRLAQKMEFLVKDTAHLAEPSEEDLQRYYDANHTRYQEPAYVSFSQVFFREESSALQGMQELAVNDANIQGDRILLERDHTRIDKQALANLFGIEFADALVTLETGQWQGPVASAYGYHLVFITDHQPAYIRPFAEVQARVRNDWYQARREEMNKQYFAGLMKKYDIVVDESIKPLIGSLPGMVQ